MNPCVLVRLEAITKYHRLGWLKQQTFIFSQCKKLKVQGQGACPLVSPETSLVDLQIAALRMPLHIVNPLFTGTCNISPSVSSFPLLIRTPVILDKDPTLTLRASFKLHLFRLWLHNHYFEVRGVWTSTYEFGGYTIQRIAP